MEKSKKTLKMLGICIIGILIVVAINMLKGPEDPFKNLQGGKVLYQHIEEKNFKINNEYHYISKHTDNQIFLWLTKLLLLFVM